MIKTNKNGYFDVIQIFGCKRSGTNYLTLTLNQSFECVGAYEFAFAHKHETLDDKNEIDFSPIEYDLESRQNSQEKAEKINAIVDTLEPDDITPVLIIKNPYAWCNSYEKANYLSSIEDAIDDWIAKNKQWIDFLDQFPNSYIFYYHDLLENTEGVLTDFMQELEHTDDISVPDGYGERVSKQGKEKNEREFDPSFYTEHRYMGELGADKCYTVTRKLIQSNARWKG